MTEALHQQRCRIHPEREAMARCPSCGDDYCRECVNDHEGRLLCAACIREIKDEVQGPEIERESGLRLACWLSLCVLGLWGLIYVVGRILLIVPMETHD